jgi:hypothetical protein
MDLDGALDELYAAAPEDFVAVRARLAKALKADGRGEDAAGLAKVRKPPLAAWALNQLARRNRRDVDLLLDSGNRLREAQAGVLGGAERDSLARAAAAQREAVERLTREAEGLLAERGSVSPGVVVQIADSLRAAAVSPEGRELLARGRFTGPLESEGFDLVGRLAAPAPKPKKADRSKELARAAEAAAAVREAKQRLKEAEKAAREARTEAARLEGEAAKARRAAAQAEDAVEAATREVADAEARAPR